MNDRTTVDVWVDPICPWAWRTAQWLQEAEQVRDLAVRYNIMSLSLLNEGRDDVDRRYKLLLNRGWAGVRVCVAARERHGPGIIRPLYSAMARHIHEEGTGMGDRMVRAALAEVGLPGELAEAATSTEFDDLLRASHMAGLADLGDAAGTPILHSGGRAFFGPVVNAAPAGEAAGQLWDAVAVLASAPEFFEFKRARGNGDVPTRAR
ncbi:DsbA family protein [Longispora albida]|uniref:mycothiol-dependent nitroreductase Rv2466c family protein n=1 Tax=Longispora albida TaxID=203523 RepID=UPI00036F571A|nr:DsbA family protein [Longispora albida]